MMQARYSAGLPARAPPSKSVFDVRGSLGLFPQGRTAASANQAYDVPQASIIRATSVPAPTPPQALLSGTFPGDRAGAAEAVATTAATAATLPAAATVNDGVGGPLEATQRVIGEAVPEIGGACGFFCRNRYAFWLALVGAVLLVALAYYLSAQFECRKWAREPAGAWLARRASAGLAVPRFRSAGIMGDVEVATQGGAADPADANNDAKGRGDRARRRSNAHQGRGAHQRSDSLNHHGRPWSFDAGVREPVRGRPQENTLGAAYNQQRATACPGGGCRWELVEEPWFEPALVQQVWSGPTPAFAPDDVDHVYDR
jgi:hypothetical protein